MGIQGLSPLQRWLEKIDDYLAKEDMLKARLASFVLPIFEAMEWVTTVHHICFYASSKDELESRSHLMIKASILAFNVLFSWYFGLKDPKACYRFHQICQLTYQKSLQEQIQDELLNIQDQDVAVSPQKKQEAEEDELLDIEDRDVELSPQKKQEAEEIVEELVIPHESLKAAPPNLQEKQSPPHLVSDSENGEKKAETKVNKLVTRLKQAPQTLQRKNSFDDVRKKLAEKAKSTKKFRSVPLRKKSFTQLPFVGNLTGGHPHVRRLASAPSVMDIFQNPPLSKTTPQPILNVKSSPNLLKTSQKISLDIKELDDQAVENIPTTSQASKKIAEELKPILEFIQAIKSQEGSWIVKDGKIIFRQYAKHTKACYFSAEVLDVLSKVHKKGFFSLLDIDQAYNLNCNLKVYDLPSTTKKGNQTLDLIEMSNTLQKHIAELLIKEDINNNHYYTSCYQLIDKILHLLESQAAFTTDDRLFEKSDTSDLGDLFHEWKFSLLTKKKWKGSLQEYSHILQTYFDHLPDHIRQELTNLKNTQDKNSWYQALDTLSNEDKILIKNLLTMLSSAYQKIWGKNLKEMLKATSKIVDMFCPNAPSKNPIDEQTFNEALLKNLLSDFSSKTQKI